ncbi:hypothetical protein SEA_ANNADREAMY_264 [Streptomyces phage Annadreamy]|uniref:Uncharacterized protein n=2 Tax=Annadreamyvirus annadreamy TaxID=2846392 RepID=A0A345GTS1_9CAUD|nr:hypothetical protein HWB75_gp001 [Streptomyces phage Annadreamy]YP_009839197.1 hypothetical protein HWB75_gp015 [Streptomyces phage Annadreamy]QGH79337.1 hypothetical protein SEA_LIMPID_1 [Streptomyces phage Limpid]AXG66125.1 hypothetical protein SEA_ANNADREAMY_1 [Streptomyces phage Annadreamy]AXG66343.1 hypothetical protein SEA_ANNADREAMY_264 [Streptomyces phage Annadreamy]QGH79571.1 hypothetical protein SEA_LIMPID_270 [Streptomyces phage Limpid]
MGNLAYQYIDRPNSKSGTVYGAYLLFMDTDTVVVPAMGRDIHKLWAYVGNGNMGIGKERLRHFLQLPSFTLNPAQYNTTVTQYVMSKDKPFNMPNVKG